MDPSVFNKALLKKANHGSYARVFGSRILSKRFGILLWRRVPHQQSRRLTVKRINMHANSVEAPLPKRWWFCQAHGRVLLSPSRATTNDFAVWILKWVAFDCKRRMALFFEFDYAFSQQHVILNLAGKKHEVFGTRHHFKTEVLKVKPVRVMPKGLRTTWPLSIALPEIRRYAKKGYSSCGFSDLLFFEVCLCLHFNRSALWQAPWICSQAVADWQRNQFASPPTFLTPSAT